MCAGDCDDTNPAQYPSDSILEVCDNRDNDCDGVTDFGATSFERLVWPFGEDEDWGLGWSAAVIDDFDGGGLADLFLGARCANFADPNGGGALIVFSTMAKDEPAVTDNSK